MSSEELPLLRVLAAAGGGVEGGGWGERGEFGKSGNGTSSYVDPGDVGLSLA
jgi:hypothetical protein